MSKKTFIGAGSLAMLVIATGVVLTTLALYRYGGADGVVRRVKSEFIAEQPHPDFVPTPEDLVADAPDDATLGALAAALPAQVAASQPVTQAQQSAAITSRPSGINAKRSLAQFAALIEPVDVVLAAGPAPQEQATATPLPESTATPMPTFPPTKRLQGLAHYWQTWNNCGPATLSMNLSYFGVKIGQDKIGAALKPEKDDKNVGPEQLAEFARGQGLRALVRINGDATQLKALLAADIPVLVETWYEPKPNDGMGHYRLIVGYDDAAKHWIAYDSYDSHGIKKGDAYAGVHFPYDSFDKIWRVFGRTYIPIYDEARAGAVEAVIGADMDDQAMWRRALAEDLVDINKNPNDQYVWFNIGTDYVALGDYTAAAQAYDTARRIKLPWRMLWYQFGPFKAYYEVGRHKEVIALADATIKTAKNDEELYYWKGMSQQALGDLAGARASYEIALRQRPTYEAAQAALASLE